jgi:hypothetical protein
MGVEVMGVIVVRVRRLAGSCERPLVEQARNVDRAFRTTRPAPVAPPDVSPASRSDPGAGAGQGGNAAVLLSKSDLVINSRSASAICFTASY